MKSAEAGVEPSYLEALWPTPYHMKWCLNIAKLIDVARAAVDAPLVPAVFVVQFGHSRWLWGSAEFIWSRLLVFGILMMKREASQSVRQPLCRLFILCVFIWGCSCSMVRRRSSRGWGRTSFGHGNDKLLLLWTTSAVGRPERRRQTHEHLPHGLLGSGAVLLSDHEDVGWSEIELVRVWIKINTDDAFCGFWFAVKVINTWRARLQFGFCLYVGFIFKCGEIWDNLGLRSFMGFVWFIVIKYDDKGEGFMHTYSRMERLVGICSIFRFIYSFTLGDKWGLTNRGGYLLSWCWSRKLNRGTWLYNVIPFFIPSICSESTQSLLVQTASPSVQR